MEHNPVVNNTVISPVDFLMQQVDLLPFWAKLVIYSTLQQEFKTVFSQSTLLSFAPEHTIQLWVPEPNLQVLSDMQKRREQLDSNVQRLLQMMNYKKNVVSISVLSQWSLAQCTEVLTLALDKEMIIPPSSAIILSTIYYLAGRIRLGEYLLKINRLTVEQLDQALRTQKNIEETMGERVGIANVLINLNYIKKEDSEAILHLKEDSKKSFPKELMSLTSSAGAVSSNSAGDQTKIAQLEAQLQQAVQHIRKMEAYYKSKS
jgi:hypothetical protein